MEADQDPSPHTSIGPGFIIRRAQLKVPWLCPDFNILVGIRASLEQALAVLCDVERYQEWTSTMTRRESQSLRSSLRVHVKNRGNGPVEDRPRHYCSASRGFVLLDDALRV